MGGGRGLWASLWAPARLCPLLPGAWGPGRGPGALGQTQWGRLASAFLVAVPWASSGPPEVCERWARAWSSLRCTDAPCDEPRRLSGEGGTRGGLPQGRVRGHRASPELSAAGAAGPLGRWWRGCPAALGLEWRDGRPLLWPWPPHPSASLLPQHGRPPDSSVPPPAFPVCLWVRPVPCVSWPQSPGASSLPAPVGLCPCLGLCVSPCRRASAEPRENGT